MNITPENFFKRRIHIDEEGYPMFDGLRIDDEESLREIFANLKRVGPLVTTWGGQDATVESFSSPFVIQSVSQKSDSGFVAKIFSDVEFDFELSELQIDEWDRLHLYLGTDKIESTFSRKAQSELLMLMGENIEFAKFRQTSDQVSSAERWQKAYDDKEDGWDLGYVSPSLVELATKWLVADKIMRGVLVPGAGRGYEADWLAQKGHWVVAEDFAPSARSEFYRLYPDSKVSFQTSDFFRKLSAEDGGYDAIVELIFFCAIDPNMRARYFKQCFERLKPGGLLVGIFFMNYGPGGPPFSTTQWELRAYAKNLFHIKHWCMSQSSVEPRLGKEFEVVLQKPL